MAKKVNELQKLVGKKVKFNEQGIIAGYPQSLHMLKEYKVLKVVNNTLYLEYPNYPGGYAINSYYINTKILSSKNDFEEEIESLKSTINDINLEIDNINSKIKFMKDIGLEEFDEETFKSFKILELIEKSKMSKIDKAKKISEIVKA